jgi:hypothetical protein
MREYARVKLNGKELEAHASQSYRWEVTNIVTPGSNQLDVEVRATAGGGGGGTGRRRRDAGFGLAGTGAAGGGKRNWRCYVST